jgi:hypothetical protein
VTMMTPEDRAAAVGAMVQVMTQAGVSGDDAAKAAPALIDATGPGDATITAQLTATISGQLDLSAATREKARQTAHDTASAHAKADERRDAHGRFASTGVRAQSKVYNDVPETRGISRGKSTYESGGGTGRSAADRARLDAFRRQQETETVKPIGMEGARGNSRAVTADQFQKIAAEGRTRLHAIQDAPWSVHGLFQNWDAIKTRAYAEVRKSWGGATVDPRTGEDLPQGADKYAMSVKPTGLDTTSIPEGASAAEFDRAMDTALGKYRKQLAKGGSYLGIFHDDDLGRIDIDPVTVLDTLQEVETIGAYTAAIGGAYHFASGDGFWPPHVPSGAQMSAEDEQHHWAGPGQWRSQAAAVQQPHDEPEDTEDIGPAE